MHRLSESVERKFINTINLDEWQIETEDGWKDLSSVSKTVPYEVYYLITDQNKTLECADDHIIFDDYGQELFVKDSLGKKILTKNGPEKVVELYSLGYEEEMYDLEVNSDKHTYYSNDILSHNTATVAMLFLWYTTFFEDMAVGVTSKSNPNVKDVIDRAKYAYENLPPFLQESVTSYNVFNLAFNNGSSIIGETTGPNTFRGRSLNVIFIDEMAHNSPHVVNEMWKSLLPIIDANENQKLIITSTPNGTGDLFSQIVFNARAKRNNFALVELDDDEYPEAKDPTFRERKLREMSLNEYLQEYRCVSYDTIVEVMINGSTKKMKIGELYGNL